MLNGSALPFEFEIKVVKQDGSKKQTKNENAIKNLNKKGCVWQTDEE